MKIAYRRLSGAIGLSMEEKGTRGMWWEKRKAFLRTLDERGHEVNLTGRLTAPTARTESTTALTSKHKILFIEFGSTNAQFYGDDLKETQEQISRHKGITIFLCDDPDLPFPWKMIPKDCEFHCWYNSRLKPILAGQPPGLKTMDYPFAANQQSPIFTAPPISHKLVYMGRPKGREKLFRWLSDMNLPISIHGRAKEWEGYNFQFQVLDAPTQPQRSTWYSNQLGSLGIADAKHKRMQWRTGRITHSILSGCPVIIEHDNDTFSLPKFSSTEEINLFIKQASNPDTRGKMLIEQQKLVTNGTARIEATLSEYGL